MDILAPEPERVAIIDFDIILTCGKDLTFSVRPDVGDVERLTVSELNLTFARTNHQVRIAMKHVAVISRVERQIVLVPKGFEPKPNER